MNLGIDAGDLLTERRGKSRYLRSVLAVLATADDMTTTLLCPSGNIDVLTARYAHPRLRVADYKTARRDNAYDVVWFPWNTLNFSTPAPTVLTIHDTYAFTDPLSHLFKRRREKKALVRSVREADEIVTCSFWSRQLVSELLDVDEPSITVVPPMPDSSWHPALDPLPYPDIAEMPYVLVLPGRRGDQNFTVFLRAFAKAFKKRQIRLVVCGDLPVKSRRRFEKLAYTRVLQPDDGELRALYRNAAAVAIPSTQESFSFTAAEASACGAALIAANAGALPETIGTSSLLVDPKNRHAWVRGLLEVIDDQAHNAKLRARAVSSWNSTSRNAFIDQLLTVFRRAAES